MGATVACRGCGRENASSQRYCGACGAALALVCSECGTENPGDFRFCGGCGRPMGTEPRPGALEERRWATVLFADLSGFTSLAEGMDPEDVRALVDGCMDRLGRIVEEHGGTVINVMGDGIMAAFGAPVAHEDDPERAVRAAIAMRECAVEHASNFGGLPLRVGVNTGEVMFAPVGPEGRRDPTLSGDTTNTASRLETAAPIGGVLVGEETYLATRRTIRYEDVGPLRVKGKEGPVRARLAVEVLAEPAARPVSEGPIVGRDHELELLRTIAERVRGEARPHLVTVIGPAGIGKSKIARAVAAGLERDGWRVARGRSLPYGERAGYGAFGALVKAVASILETDQAEDTRRKLEETVAELVGPDAVDVANHLALLVGLPTERPEVDKRTLFGAARTFVESLSSRGPTVLLIEDLHWADPSLLELIEWLVGRVHEAPTLFLTVARPELFDTRPGWGGGQPSYTALPLEPLSPGASRALAESLVARAPAATDLASEIERSAAGNPLFIEELAAWMTDEDRPRTQPLPTTVTSIMAARLDALAPALREVLLEASVVGEVFWRGAIDPERSPDLHEVFDELEARGFIRHESGSRIRDDEEFTFKHAMVRDVAYGHLPKTTRRKRHREVAEYLERASGGGGAFAAILAHHWREAGETEQAITYLVEAADRASLGWAKAEAVQLYAEALELLDVDDERYPQIVRKRAVTRTMFMHSVLDAPTLHSRTGD